MSHNFPALGHYWNNNVKQESQITSLSNSLFRKTSRLKIKCPQVHLMSPLVQIVGMSCDLQPYCPDSRMKRRAELSSDQHLMETGSDCRRRCQKDLRSLHLYKGSAKKTTTFGWGYWQIFICNLQKRYKQILKKAWDCKLALLIAFARACHSGNNWI